MTTTSYVRREGEVIRHNFGWTLVLLGWLILIGLFYYYVLPQAMRCDQDIPRARPQLAGSRQLEKSCRHAV